MLKSETTINSSLTKYKCIAAGYCACIVFVYMFECYPHLHFKNCVIRLHVHCQGLLDNIFDGI